MGWPCLRQAASRIDPARSSPARRKPSGEQVSSSGGSSVADQTRTIGRICAHARGAVFGRPLFQCARRQCRRIEVALNIGAAHIFERTLLLKGLDALRDDGKAQARANLYDQSRDSPTPSAWIARALSSVAERSSMTALSVISIVRTCGGRSRSRKIRSIVAGKASPVRQSSALNDQLT